MELTFARNWWAVMLRGVVAVLAGIVAFVWPGITLTAVALVFGAYALLDGIFNLVSAVKGIAHHQRWAALLVEAAFGIAAGLIALVWPGLTVLAIVLVIGAWAIVTGALEIAAAFRLRRHIAGEWLLALGGIASVLFGALLIAAPMAGAVVIAWWLGAYAIVFGALLIGLALRLRRLAAAGPGLYQAAH